MSRPGTTFSEGDTFHGNKNRQWGLDSAATRKMTSLLKRFSGTHRGIDTSLSTRTAATSAVTPFVGGTHLRRNGRVDFFFT
jgi:hypothetical protein